jgi:hypothetical protein
MVAALRRLVSAGAIGCLQQGKRRSYVAAVPKAA